MEKVRVRCPECGPIVLTSDHIELVVAVGRPIEADSAHYAFTCTGCGSYHRRAVDGGTAAKLILAGVIVRQPAHPAGRGPRPHPEVPPAGPPFTYDDLLDLHLLLDDPRWWGDLLQHEVGTSD